METLEDGSYHTNFQAIQSSNQHFRTWFAFTFPTRFLEKWIAEFVFQITNLGIGFGFNRTNFGDLPV